MLFYLKQIDDIQSVTNEYKERGNRAWQMIKLVLGGGVEGSLNFPCLHDTLSITCFVICRMNMEW